MKLSKKMVSLMCLSLMVMGCDKSSVSNIIDNSNLSSKVICEEVESTVKSTGEDIELEGVEQIDVIEEEQIEEERKSRVTYLRTDMTIASDITKDELKEVFMNYTGASSMAHLAQAFVDAEKEYGVNVFAMAGIVALESGFATSRRAVEDNNLTGYEVYSDDSEGRLFSSQYDSIMHTARHLSKNYLTVGGTYYNGVSVDDVQISYCPDEGKGKNWDEKVDILANGFLDTYKEIYKLQ